MNIKIASKEDAKKIGVGSILYKYPADGSKSKTLDLTDKDKFLEFEVSLMNDNKIELSIPQKDIINPSIVMGYPQVTGILSNPPIMTLSIDELILQDVWWLQQS